MFKRAPSYTLAIIIFGAAVAGGGCASVDQHAFVSTETRPVNVALLATGQDQTLWEMQVPINHRLVVKLNRRDEAELFATSGRPADHMLWSLYEQDAPRRVANGDVELGGIPTRLYITYRSPGHPGDPTPITDLIDEDESAVEELQPRPEEQDPQADEQVQPTEDGDQPNPDHDDPAVQ